MRCCILFISVKMLYRCSVPRKSSVKHSPCFRFGTCCHFKDMRDSFVVWAFSPGTTLPCPRSDCFVANRTMCNRRTSLVRIPYYVLMYSEAFNTGFFISTRLHAIQGDTSKNKPLNSSMKMHCQFWETTRCQYATLLACVGSIVESVPADGSALT